MDKTKNWCTYDNPGNHTRECWVDGELVCTYSYRVLPPCSDDLVASGLIFWGANIGPWVDGRLVGNRAAMEYRNNETNDAV